MRKLILPLAAAALLLFGCAEPIRTGIVMEKKYEPAREWTTTEWRCIMRNSETGICQVNMPYERDHYEPEHYRLYLRGERDGETAYGWVEVTSREYDKCIFGRRYPDCLPT